MRRKKLLAGILSLAMVLTLMPVGGASVVSGSETTEITMDKTLANPIGGYDSDGNLIYGGDPSILVDGDTVYLYTGHDTPTTEDYIIPEYLCYSTKDLVNWTYEGVVFSMTNCSWATGTTSAWAGQVMEYNGKYYMYYCTWDSTSSGKQSIGVAVSDSPTGTFVDIGEPLVKGTVTTNETSGWNDIDPTAWIETDANGEVHRYLCWGNGKNFICELNEDMISVKDVNGDGEITFGTEASGATSATADIIEKTVDTLSYTEAPWLYRRQDENGDYYGDYYLFYAYGWREQLAYATIDEADGLMDGTWTYGTDGTNGYLMAPTSTSNTHHIAVFDFNGKTYLVDHDGSLPGGSGFRRIATIQEITFNEDGSIDGFEESAVGVFGETTTLYNSKGLALAHESFVNSASDDAYPYTDITVGITNSADSADAQWAIVAGKADTDNGAYVSIQSENKPGLYLTANDDSSVTLAQDYDLDSLEETAKRQTFRTVAGLDGSEDGVSFESVYYPGTYLTIVSGSLALTDGSDSSAATFFTTAPDLSDGATENAVSSIVTADDATIEADGKSAYTLAVSYKLSTLNLTVILEDENGYFIYNSLVYASGDTISVAVAGDGMVASIDVYAEAGNLADTCTLTLNLDYSDFSLDDAYVYGYSFEQQTDGAYAVKTGTTPKTVEDPEYTYGEGYEGEYAIRLDGSYGLKLADGAALGDSYTISFWMLPDSFTSSYINPILAGGTFSPQYWFNLTTDAKIWSYDGSYLATTAAEAYVAGEWQNVVLVVDGGSGKLYLNGELISEGSIAENILTQDGAAIYFAVNGWDAYWTGLLDEVTMYNRALNSAEVGKIADGTVTVASLLNSGDDTEEPDDTDDTEEPDDTDDTEEPDDTDDDTGSAGDTEDTEDAGDAENGEDGGDTGDADTESEDSETESGGSSEANTENTGTNSPKTADTLPLLPIAAAFVGSAAVAVAVKKRNVSGF